MRHRKSGRHLNRDSAHRKAMFRNMAVSLIEHEVIRTTVPKAKELRRVAEPLITLAKKDTVANRRLAFRRTGSKAAVGKLFTELGPRYVDRPGGYVRIVRAGHRAGDSAPVAVMELVNRPDRSYDDELAKETTAAAVTPPAPAGDVQPERTAPEISEAAEDVADAAKQDEDRAPETEEAAPAPEKSRKSRSILGRLRGALKKEP